MLDGAPAAGTAATADDEAYETLVQIAGRRTSPVPAEILVRHALALPGSWDWPVRRAAFEAILRRFESVRGQELGVLEGPRRGPWGRYRLGRGGAGAVLPYDVRLSSVAPVRGACDCPDFLRGSLGLCKHLLAVLAHLARKRPVFQRILETPPAVTPAHVIVWDAATSRPGATDPLEALGLSLPTSDRREIRRAGKRGGSLGARATVPSVLPRLFRPDGPGCWRLKATYAADPAARLRLVLKLEEHARGARASLDPAARAVLTQERGRLERVLRLRAAAPRIQRALARSKRRLYAYQKEGVRRFLVEGRLVLADDMGLGKTTQAIVASSALFDAGLVQRGLFVVPASLKPQWEREWRAVSDAPLKIVDGGAEERRRIYHTSGRGFLVTNYEQVVRDFEAIVRWAPDVVVLDEAQRIKNWATKTALTVKRLKPDFRLVLSGTPMENRLEELASVVEWVDDRALEPKWRLVPWHSAYADGAREVVGARNLDSLRTRLAPVLLRRVRAEVLSQLPARQDSVIPVELTAEQRDAHDELMQPIAKLAAIARRRPLTQAEFLRLMSLLLTQRVISNGMAQLNFDAIWPAIRGRPPTAKVIESLGAPKLLELRELIASLVLTQRRKVVVFSQFRRMLDLAAWAVSDLLVAEGLRSLFFTGQEGGRRRTQNLVDFHDDPRAAVLFLTDAGGVGLNLQKAANACINLELPWNPAVLEQRIGRIHRLGQKRPIDVYNLVSRDCIEERIASLVADKRALFKGLFDGSTDQLRFEGSGALRQVLARLTAGIEETPSSTGEQDEENSADRPVIDPLAPGGGPEGQPHAATSGADELVAAAEPSDLRGPGTPSLRDDAPASQDDVDRLFEALTVEKGADGGIRIQAPAHAARALMSVFAGMARLLGAVEEASTARPSGNGASAAPRDA
jgi:superfamily II DNA or RNA helicase